MIRPGERSFGDARPGKVGNGVELMKTWLDRRTATLLTALLLLILPAVVAPAAQAAASFAPHRAVYDLTLDRSRGGSSGIHRAGGKMEFEWSDVCDAWIISQRARIRLTAGDGQVIEFGWSFNAFEQKDGRNYRFSIRRFGSYQETELLRGEAWLDEPGERGRARFIEPEPREVELPRGTLFPTAHSLALMEAAERGEIALWRTVFDGSSENGLFDVNVTVSHALPAEAAVAFDSPLTRGQPSWRLQIAFFDSDATGSEPEHEQAMRLFKNGVADEMYLDYGDFALRATLEALSEIPPLPC